MTTVVSAGRAASVEEQVAVKGGWSAGWPSTVAAVRSRVA
jgi:hypothetical protein